MTFGEWLDATMTRRRLTNYGLAPMAGVDKSTISRIRRGERDPGISVARRLVEALRETYTLGTPPPVYLPATRDEMAAKRLSFSVRPVMTTAISIGSGPAGRGVR